jgi:hypothetical protein
VKIDPGPDTPHAAPGADPKPHLLEGRAALLDLLLGGLPVARIELGVGEVSKALGTPSLLAAIPIPAVLERVPGSRRLELVEPAEPHERDATPLLVRAAALFQAERTLQDAS